MTRIKAGVLGSTGIVGQQFVRMLAGHPYFELATLSASPRSAGKTYASAQQWAVGGDVPKEFLGLTVVGTGIEELLGTGTRVFFSALPASMAGALESALREKGAFVFTNASGHRTDADCPILIADVNPEHLEVIRVQIARAGGFIVPGSNCSTSGLVMVLKPILQFGIREIAVTTFQSISGAGRRGLAAMDIAGNLIPLIKGEEEKIERETRKILGRIEGEGIAGLPVDIRAGCCRVPVREGHLLHIEIGFDKAPDAEAVLSAIASYRSEPQELNLPSAPERPLILRTEDDRPQPALDVWAGSPNRARGMAVTVGRPRFRGRHLDLFALVHNTVRGAAGMCLLNAEFVYKKGLLG
jgi:aspartate-semialdehyde dehydrogenase